MSYSAQTFDLALLVDLQNALSNTNVGAESALQRILSASSQFILSRINRTIFNKTYNLEAYDGNGNDLLTLNNYPVNTVSLVQVSGYTGLGLGAPSLLGLTPNVIPASADGIQPGYVLDATSIYLIGGYQFPVGCKNVQVIYTAGYGLVSMAAWINSIGYSSGQYAIGSDFNVYVSIQNSNTGNDPTRQPSAWWALVCPMLPTDLSQAAIELAAFKYKKQSTMGQDSMTLAGQTVSFTKSDVPSEVQTTINNYKRRFTI